LHGSIIPLQCVLMYVNPTWAIKHPVGVTSLLITKLVAIIFLLFISLRMLDSCSALRRLSKNFQNGG